MLDLRLLSSGERPRGATPWMSRRSPTGNPTKKKSSSRIRCDASTETPLAREATQPLMAWAGLISSAFVSAQEQKKEDQQEERKEVKGEEAASAKAVANPTAAPVKNIIALAKPNADRKRKLVGVDMWHMSGVESRGGKLKRDEKAGWFCTASTPETGQVSYSPISDKPTPASHPI